MRRGKKMQLVDWAILGWLVFKTAMDIAMIMYVIFRLVIKK